VVDVKREYTPHINQNDCWALVLSKVSGRQYNDIYQEIRQKGYADDNGLFSQHMNAILEQYGYYPVQIISCRQRSRYGKVAINIDAVLRALPDEEMVIGSMNLEKKLSHLSYGCRGVDYTTSETDDSMYDPVLYLWVKRK